MEADLSDKKHGSSICNQSVRPPTLPLVETVPLANTVLKATSSNMIKMVPGKQRMRYEVTAVSWGLAAISYMSHTYMHTLTHADTHTHA